MSLPRPRHLHRPSAALGCPSEPDTPRRAGLGRWLAGSVAVWLLFGAVMVLLAHGDASRRAAAGSLMVTGAQLLPYFLPLVLFSAGCGWSLARRPPVGGVGEVLSLWALALGLFIPVNALFSAGFSAWLVSWPQLPEAAAWGRQVRQLSLTNLWIDAMIASGAFAALLAWTSWRQRQADARRWQAAQADNLRLRLQLLQGQLEPHFLFNALNSVSALVRSGDRAVALTALEQISTLLRLALRASRSDRVSVADELAFARTYLAVQSLRFGDALTVDWDVDGTDLDDLACPPLLLQPLIENAVVHGLESNRGRGHITIQVWARDIPPSEQAALPADAVPRRALVVRIGNSLGPDAPAAGHGVGLHSTRERLRLLYGDRASVHIEADEGHHQVELSLPAELLS